MERNETLCFDIESNYTIPLLRNSLNVVNWTTVIEYLFNLNHYLDWHVSCAKLCSVKNELIEDRVRLYTVDTQILRKIFLFQILYDFPLKDI